MKLNLRALLLALCCSCSAFSASGQQNPEPMKKNTIFVELLGNANYIGSINYDRILIDKAKWKLAGRIGGRYFRNYDEANGDKYLRYAVPLEVSILKGKGNHYLELGAGLTPGYKTSVDRGEYDQGEPFLRQELEVLLIGRVGYRYQRKCGGMFYKVGWTPLGGPTYNLNRESPHWESGEKVQQFESSFWYGLAMGYTF